MQRDLRNGIRLQSSLDQLEFLLPEGYSSVVFKRHDHWVSARFSFGTGRTGADVSCQPGAVVHHVEQSARELAIDPNRWALSMLRELRDWSGTLDWCDHEPRLLCSAIGALSHPLLGALYSEGFAALSDIPRWASPILRCNSLLSAARSIDATATRRTAKALAHSLSCRQLPAHPDLEGIAFALMAAEHINADEMANLLEVTRPQLPRPLPTGDQINEVRQALTLWPTSRRAAVLIDAAVTGGAVECATTMQRLWWVQHQLPQPLSIRWHELRAIGVPNVPVADGPDINSRHTQPYSRRTASRVPVQRPRDAAIETALRAPRVHRSTTVRHATEWPIPDALALVNGLCYEPLDFELVVPTSVEELREWGAILHNCLADYGPAIASGRAWIIGIVHHNTLVGAVEVEPGHRTVRQILGDRNRTLPTDLRNAVIEALRYVHAAV